jgi:2-polyprenyl-6-methoxyphenol hydroxylase-like FAD-dependent oxidoreductase
MTDLQRHDGTVGTGGANTASASFDAVIVGGSLAGCAAAMLLAREGARVAVLEKQPDPAAFKRICSHFIQASAVPTIERLGLYEPMMAAGAVRSRFRARTKWGWIEAPPEKAGYAINLRREVLDPMVREMTSGTDGVELLLGRTAQALRRDGATVTGVVVRDHDGVETTLEAPLVIGADGRDSTIAELAEVKVKTYPHGRFAYGGYFEDATPASAPDGSVWFMDPDWGAAFPTDSGQTFYAAMPTKARLPEFKADPEAALLAFFDTVPDGPPLRAGHRVSPVLGKIDMTNRMRVPTAPGLALIGDAALATDPLFGVGCGWAFQSAEWLSDAVAPALRGEETLETGLRRYRRRHGRALRGHAFMIHNYANGRKLSPPERLIFSAAARDPKVAIAFDEFGTRQCGPAKMMARTMPRAVAVNLRHALRERREHSVAGGAGVGSAA